MAHRTNNEGEIEEIDLPVVHTEILMIRGTPEGEWYFPSDIGLHHGPWPSKEIAMIEYYRWQHGRLTGELYVSAKQKYDIEGTLAMLDQITEENRHPEFGTNFETDDVDFLGEMSRDMGLK